MILAGKYRWITVGTALGIAVAALIIATVLFLPVYIEKRLIPRWVSDAGLAPDSVNIRRVAFNGADAGPIRLAMGDARFLEIAAVQIDYSLRSLWDRRIDAIVLSGVNLTLFLNKEGNAFVGWGPGPQPHEPPTIPDLKTLLPVALGHIGVRNAIITVHWQDRTFRATAEADLDTGDLRQGRLHGAMQLNVRGSRFNISAAADDRANQIDLQLEGRDMAIADFLDLLAAPGETEASGRLDLTTRVDGTLRPLVLTSLTATGRLKQFHIDNAGMRLSNTNGENGIEVPVIVQLNADDRHHYRWSASPFQSTRPLTMHVDRFEGQVVRDQNGLRATATARTGVLPQTLVLQGQPPVRIDRLLALQWTLAAGSAEDDAVVLFEAHGEVESGTANHLLNLQTAQAAFTGRGPYFKLAGRYNAGRTQARFDAGMEGFEASHPQGNVHSPGVSINGEVHTGNDHRIDMVIDLPNTQARLGDTTVRLPKSRWEAVIARAGTDDWRMMGNLNLAGVRIHYKPQDLGIDDLAIRLPIQWPVAPESPAGTVNAAAVLWKSRDIGGIKGVAALKPGGLQVDIDHASKLLPGLNVSIQTAVGISETTVSASIPSYAPSTAVDLTPFFPSAAGVTVNGRIEAQAWMAIHDGLLTGEARIELEQGMVRQDQRQLALEGIAGKLHIADLATLRSAPGQRLTVDRLTMGNIKAENMAIDFQIEPEHTLFIEKAVLAWCQGSVQAAAVRLKPDLSEVAVTLHCDRLNLAMLLEQLSAARGSGEGSVNGRIPLRWQEGLLSFDNGFLYSTPGQTGTIQLHDTQFLLAGLPPGSPQHIQLDIATEALKDYSYNWARLNLESRKERLLLSLELDGKPNQLLPFAYHPQTGKFERVEGQGQAEFKGIGFTLNFDTPLTEILHYKDFMTPKR